jgi:hypothetical protein
MQHLNWNLRKYVLNSDYTSTEAACIKDFVTDSHQLPFSSQNANMLFSYVQRNLQKCVYEQVFQYSCTDEAWFYINTLIYKTAVLRVLKSPIISMEYTP